MKRKWHIGAARPLLVAILSLAVAGCQGYTPRGAAYASAGVLVAANNQVLDECRRSKAQATIEIASATPEQANNLRAEWKQPFTHNVCQSLSLAYKTASLAAEQALDLTKPGEATPSNLTAAGIQYVYTVAALLAKAGVKPVGQVSDFLDVVNAQLLKTTEVK